MSLDLTKSLELYLVSDHTLTEEKLLEKVEAAVKGGVTVVQLREKELAGRAFFEKAIRLKQVLDQYHVPLIINDRVDIALACGAAGVHVGRDDLPVAQVRKLIPAYMILGASARTMEEALEAQAAGADYIGAGSVFRTTTKSDAKLIKLTRFKQIVEKLTIPVVAIGGITTDNVMELSGTGAAGVAVVSGILGHENPSEKAADFRKKLRQF